MKNIFLKIFAMGLVFLLGISKEVAAQYGVVQCSYLFKGKVESGLCKKGIEGMLVTVGGPESQVSPPVEAITDSNGNFEVTFSCFDCYDCADQLWMKVEDIDGEDNLGSYVSQECRIPLNRNKGEFFFLKEGEWEEEYLFLQELKFLMRKEASLPCLEE